MKRIPEPALMEDAENCERYNKKLSGNQMALDRFVEIYKNYIGIESGTIVDLGSGSANFLIELCLSYPNLKVIGYESSKAMINIANRNIAANKLEDRITIVDDDFFNATGTYDVVIAHRVLHHVDDTTTFWKLIRQLSDNILVWDIERPRAIVMIPVWYDDDIKNSFKAAYTIAEVTEQVKEYGYKIINDHEKVGFGYLVYRENKIV